MNTKDRTIPRRWNTATLAAAFAVLLTSGILVVTGLLIVHGYREQTARTEDRASSTAQLVAVQTGWLVTASLQALERIQDRLETEQFAGDGQTLMQIREAIAHLPGDARIVIYGPDGDIRISDVDIPDGINIAHLPHFQSLQAGQPTHIAPISMPQNGPSGFAIARRLEAAGEFAGVAVVMISDGMLDDFARSLNIGRESTLSIVGEDGWLLSRFPPQTEPLYLGDYELFTEHLQNAATAGIYTADASPADGASRIVAYQTVPGQPLIAISGVSTGAVSDGFWNSTVIALGLVLPIAVTLLVLAYMLWRAAVRDQKTQERLGHALERNQLLFREIHHRVKNNLQAVSSLVQLQPIPSEAKQEMGRRISAMVAVHEHIYQTDQFERTEVSGYIEKLVRDIATSFSTQAKIETDIKPVTVHRDHAMPMGLIVNEALCNAIKYAFADGREGTIKVSLKPVDETKAVLRVEDNGVGMDPHASSDGIGHKLITGLTQQMGGTFTLNGEHGSAFELVFPLEPSPHEDE